MANSDGQNMKSTGRRFSLRLRAGRGVQPGAAKGVLIVGVQGCGKSEATKAIARQWGLPLLRLDAGRLYGSLMESRSTVPPSVTRATDIEVLRDRARDFRLAE